MTPLDTEHKVLFLLSGPVAAGKSTLATLFEKNIPIRRISTGSFLLTKMERGSSVNARYNLQEFGDRLDFETNFTWIYWDLVLPELNHAPNHLFWVLDSVRKLEQVQCLRKWFPGKVFHVHVTASGHLLKKRYDARGRSVDSQPYSIISTHPNEIAARILISVADFVFNTDDDGPMEEQMTALIQHIKADSR